MKDLLLSSINNHRLNYFSFICSLIFTQRNYYVFNFSIFIHNPS